MCYNYPKDGKADVILRYNPDEARSLKAYGELPENGIALLFNVLDYMYVTQKSIND